MAIWVLFLLFIVRVVFDIKLFIEFFYVNMVKVSMEGWIFNTIFIVISKEISLFVMI